MIKTKVVHLGYTTGQWPPIAEQWPAITGTMLPTGWRPVLAGYASVERARGASCWQNSCRGARYAGDNEAWPQERWVNSRPGFSGRISN